VHCQGVEASSIKYIFCLDTGAESQWSALSLITAASTAITLISVYLSRVCPAQKGMHPISGTVRRAGWQQHSTVSGTCCAHCAWSCASEHKHCLNPAPVHEQALASVFYGALMDVHLFTGVSCHREQLQQPFLRTDWSSLAMLCCMNDLP